MGFGLGGRRGKLDVATSGGGALFVGPVEGSIGSFGRCGVSSSVRIMLQGWRGREVEEEIVLYYGITINW